MCEKVFIKGNKYGIKISIDEDSNIIDAYKELEEKLIAGKKFFGASDISLDLDYPNKNEAVEKKVIELIEANTDLKVFCLLDESMKVAVASEIKTIKPDLDIEKKEKELGEKLKEIDKKEKVLARDIAMLKRREADLYEKEAKLSADLKSKKEIITEQKDREVSDKNDTKLNELTALDDGVEYAKFYQGTLRSGQQLKADNSIVFLGDVNPGAKIISTGNILVLGAIRGFAHAGATGKNNASIFALELKPTQLRIGEFIARAPKSFENSEASIAFVEDDRIMIDKIDKGLLKDFVLLK